MKGQMQMITRNISLCIIVAESLIESLSDKHPFGSSYFSHFPKHLKELWLIAIVNMVLPDHGKKQAPQYPQGVMAIWIVAKLDILEVTIKNIQSEAIYSKIKPKSQAV